MNLDELIVNNELFIRLDSFAAFLRLWLHGNSSAREERYPYQEPHAERTTSFWS
jgi:hypothetical protein